MKRLLLLGLLMHSGMALGETPGVHAECDEYMRTVGGPCLEGIPSASPVGAGFLPRRHRNVLGFRLGSDSFAEAKKIFGGGSEWHSGDAAGSETKFCYFVGTATNAMTLVLAMNSEMSQRIDEIRMIKGRIISRCQQLEAPLERIRTQSGLRAGMTEKELQAILGKPTYTDHGLLFYYWQNPREIGPNDTAYASCEVDGRAVEMLGSEVMARVVDGLVVWINIGYGDYAC